jgi:hypothetical protein
MVIDRKILIDAWHGQDTAAQVAEHLGVEEKDIRKAWRRMKSVKMLPEGERPRSRIGSYRESDEKKGDYSAGGNDAAFLALLAAEKRK